MATTKRKGWKLVWADEFDGKRVDRSKWDFDIGNGFYDYKNHAWVPGWGNEELQYYTHEPENVAVRDSCLVIRAVKAYATVGEISQVMRRHWGEYRAPVEL